MDIVLSEFIGIVKNIPNDGFVVSHNMEHEHTVLTNSFSPNQRILWNDAPKCDTWNIKLLKYLPSSARGKYKKRNLGVALMELYSVVCPIKDNDSVQFSHMALEDVKKTWSIFLYYITNVTSYNELQWKEDYPRYMIPGYKIHERSEQRRKFNQK